MLTGDKMETAINIAWSCGLVQGEEPKFIPNESDEASLIQQMNTINDDI